jgi:hypothetical protein
MTMPKKKLRNSGAATGNSRHSSAFAMTTAKASFSAS